MFVYLNNTENKKPKEMTLQWFINYKINLPTIWRHLFDCATYTLLGVLHNPDQVCNSRTTNLLPKILERNLLRNDQVEEKQLCNVYHNNVCITKRLLAIVLSKCIIS